jgi:hypothetical protein
VLRAAAARATAFLGARHPDVFPRLADSEEGRTLIRATLNVAKRLLSRSC